MKNKSKLLLIPTSFLLLTGCGTSADTSIPRGYAAIDKANPEARQAFFDKVGDNIASTYTKAVEGFMAEGSFSFKELSYQQKMSNGKTNVLKITDFEADYSFGLVGLNEGASKMRAVLKLEDVGFKVEVKTDKGTFKLNASDLDAAAYYTNSTLYYDLSDKNVRTFVNDAIDFSYAVEGRSDRTDKISRDKESAAKYLGKYYVKDDDVEDVTNMLPSSLSDKEVKDLKEIVGEAFETVLADDDVNNLLTLAEDKNSKGAAISLALSSDPVIAGGYTVSGDLAASLVFDKQGIFSRYGFAGNVSITGSNYSFKLSKLDLGAEFKYGSNSVKLPNFKDFKELQQRDVVIYD